MRWRFLFLTLGFTFGFLGLIAHLFNLQIEQGNGYAVRAASQYEQSGALEPERGSIYFIDKKGDRVAAALNKEYTFAFAVPTEIQDVEEASENIAHILSLDVSEVRRKLSKPGDLYEVLKEKLDPVSIEALQNAHIKGVYIRVSESRFYPFHALAAHVLGFVGETKEDSHPTGRYGIESFYNDELAGKRDDLTSRFSRLTEGSDVVLTIDRNIQSVVEEILEKLISDYRATSGTVIVADPKTGAILALGSAPDFDPNDYSSFSVSRFLNPAVESVYEPGSVFKLVTMAAGIDTGTVTPDTTYRDTGSLTLNGKTIKNWDEKSHGITTMTGVIENSLNIGAAFVESKIGHQVFLDYVNRFGVNEKTNVGLPGEVSGNTRSLEIDPRDINFATASFGQGVAVTPLQLIRAVSVIANKGIMMQPYIRADVGPKQVRRVISEETAKTITAMMVNAVDKNHVAHIPNYTVAGKTGTAQIPDFKHGGYTNEYVHTYVGFAPASDPRFIILVKIDKPAHAPLAGTTVVPAFREIAEFLLNYYTVPPDNLPATQ